MLLPVGCTIGQTTTWQSLRTTVSFLESLACARNSDDNYCLAVIGETFSSLDLGLSTSMRWGVPWHALFADGGVADQYQLIDDDDTPTDDDSADDDDGLLYEFSVEICEIIKNATGCCLGSALLVRAPVAYSFVTLRIATLLSEVRTSCAAVNVTISPVPCSGASSIRAHS